MRKIKCRAWYGDRMIYSKLDSTGWSFMGDVAIPDHNKGINDSHVMMWTGLVDKKGKEIYEGDIVKRTERSTYYADEFVIKWGVYSSRLIGFNIGCRNGKQHKSLEVIGNIYENKDMLK